MTANWKTVRVFISSTFLDMQAERDHLVRFVFPRLREQLLACRIHLVDVDLRWGVTSEQDATEVCREIINECHPRFLCMLGGRYGWVPPGKTRSITADEVYFGVLDRTLADRGFAYFYLRDDAATAAMVETNPGELREPQGDNQNKLAELKQAIIAAGLNPFTYPAQWDNESRRLTGLKKFGDRVYDDLFGSMKSDPELRDRFVTGTAAQLDEFAEENAAMEAFVEERSERFVLGSRVAVLTELLAHANAIGGNCYVCLIGAPGSGKSALLAHLRRALSAPPSSSPSAIRNPESEIVIIPHFVGASPGSTDVRRTLRRLCHELKASHPNITIEIPDDPERLRAAFSEILREACAQKRVVILLDAVNQFDATSQFTGLWWLPEELPDNARLILSTLPGPALDDLRRRRQPPREVTLLALTPADGEHIIKEFLHRYRKTMTDTQRAALLTKTDAGTPLYLLAALEELRTLGTYEEITDRIAQLPPETQALFTWILKRLEEEDGFRDASGRRIGQELVRRFASLMGVSRHGLSHRELAELLAPADVEVKPPIPGDAQGNLAALVQLLRANLMHRGELLDFYHGQFRAAVSTRYLSTEAACNAAHQGLAKYFETRWRDPDRHSLSELPFHQTQGKMWVALERTLTNLGFIEAKSAVGTVMELILDYRDAEDGLSGSAVDDGKDQQAADEPPALQKTHESLPLVVLGSLLRAEAAAISAHPTNALAQLVNRLAITMPNGPWEMWRSTLLDASRSGSRNILCLETQHHQGFDSGRRLVKVHQHGPGLRGVATLENLGVYVWVALDGTVGFCDFRTGALLRTIRVDDLFGETLLTQAWSCCVLQHHVLVGIQSGHILCIEPTSGRLIKTYRGPQEAVILLGKLDDSHFVTIYADGKIGLWQEGRVDGPTSFLASEVLPLCLSVDHDAKRIFTGSVDGTVRRWDFLDSPQATVLAKASGRVRSLSHFAKGSRLLFAAGNDVWVTDTSGEEQEAIRVFTDTSEGYSMCPIGDDCLILGTGSRGILCLDPENGRIIDEYLVSEPVISMALGPDKKTVGIITPSSLYSLELSATQSNESQRTTWQKPAEIQDVPLIYSGEPLGIVRGPLQTIRVLIRRTKEVLCLLELTGRKWRTLWEWNDIRAALIDEESETLYAVSQSGDLFKCSLGMAVESRPSREVLLSTGRGWSDTYLSLDERWLAAFFFDFNDRCGLHATFSPTAQLTSHAPFTGLLGPLGRALFVGRRYITFVSSGRGIPVFDVFNDSFRKIEVTPDSRGGMGVAVVEDLIPIGGESVVLCRTTDGSFTSLDLASGRKIGHWKPENGSPTTHACRFREAQVVLSDQSGALHCHDGLSGECLWSLRLSDHGIDGLSIDYASGRGLVWSTDGLVSLIDGTGPLRLAFWVADSRFQSCVTRVFNGKLYGVFVDTQDRLGLLAETL